MDHHGPRLRFQCLCPAWHCCDGADLVRRRVQVSSLIAQYKLNDTEALLDDILPACKARGGNVYIRAIQSRAFCLFKQYKFEKALEVFHEQAELVGPSAALFENMAHTYNSLGDYESAGKYFLQAMACMGKEGNNGKKGGILLGLSIVRERQGDPAAALPILQQALENYKQAARCAVTPQALLVRARARLRRVRRESARERTGALSLSAARCAWQDG